MKNLLTSLTTSACVLTIYYLIPGFAHLLAFAPQYGGQWTNAALCAIAFLVLVQLVPKEPKTCPLCGCELDAKRSRRLEMVRD